MARETTRKVNRQVVEALESAVNAADEASAEVNRTQRALAQVAAVTRLHDDLMEEAESVFTRLEELCDLIARRLRAERDGESR
jgi:Zn-dependent M16 (insulinase) family peptidase